jgi:hypothetical protein
MACKPPTAAVSMPYCMLAIATAEQMRRHFLLAKSVLVSRDVIVSRFENGMKERWEVRRNVQRQSI